MNTYVIIAVFIVIFALIAIYNIVQEKKRTETIKKNTENLGYEFQPKGNSELTHQLESFTLLKQGRRHKTSNTVRGKTNGVNFYLTDLQYTVGTGKSRRDYKHSIFYLKDIAHNITQFSLQPENIGHKVGSWLGYQDIDFKQYPRFSDSYLLRGKNEEEIRQFFNPDLLKYFSKYSNWHIEVSNNSIILFHRGRYTINEFDFFLNECFELFYLLNSR